MGSVELRSSQREEVSGWFSPIARGFPDVYLITLVSPPVARTRQHGLSRPN